MPRSILTLEQVAAALHLSVREVRRMAEQRILPGMLVRGAWRFRAGEVWNWMEDNLRLLPQRRRRDPDPSAKPELLIAQTLSVDGVAVDVAAKTKASILRELAAMAERVDPIIDHSSLGEALIDRELQGSTAVDHGVALPHPARPFYSAGPLLVAARTVQGIAFGDRGGGLTDLFFMICCPDHVQHLLFLGRVCRLLIDPNLGSALRSAYDAEEFAGLLKQAEAGLCGPG